MGPEEQKATVAEVPELQEGSYEVEVVRVCAVLVITHDRLHFLL